jgi:protein TonB
MAYADRDRTGENTVGIGIAVLIIAVLGWALYTGLAAEGFRALVKKVTTVDIKKDEPKKEEKPPPPKKEATPPPIVVPPPITNINTRPPPLDTTPVPAPPPPPQLAPPAPQAPPAPPPPKFQPKSAVPKSNPANWATTNDYPTRALREERAGTTGFRVTVGPDGKVTSCSITSSSGSPDLDEATCSNVTRRARFTPATDGEGNPTTGSYSNRIRWVIPTD